MTQAFNLAQLANNINTSGQLDASDGLFGTIPTANLPTIPVTQGGTGLTSITANNLIAGNGSSTVNTIAPSTSGNYLVSNGSAWVSSAPTGITNYIIGFGSSYTSNLYPSSRSAGVTYTNSSTTRPRVVLINATNSPFNGQLNVYINGVQMTTINCYGSRAGATLIIPPSATYRIDESNGQITGWQEY